MPIQDVMEATTSTEFLEWKVYLDEVEWLENERIHYYLAQIAAEIRAFRESFSSSPSPVSINDLLINFKTDGEHQSVQSQAAPAARSESKGGVEIGPDAVKDPRWARVNASAKAQWFGRLGLDVGVLLNGGQQA